MFFVQKGYCRSDGSKCRHLKVKDGKGFCKKRKVFYGGLDGYMCIRHEETWKPKNISSDPKVNIKAPSWCPKLKH